MKMFLTLPLLLVSFGLVGSIARAADAVKPVVTAPAKGFRDVTIDEFDQMRKGTNVVVLDVRTAKEYADGHLPNAVNLDFYAADFKDQLAKLDKNKTYLVHCAAGGRSAKACTAMAELKFTNSVNMLGGYNAWVKAGKGVALPPGK